MDSRLLEWVESEGCGFWLDDAVTYLEGTDAPLVEVMLRPFIQVAKGDKEFANFLLILIQKLEDRLQGSVTKNVLKCLLEDIRKDLASIVASYCCNYSSDAQPSEGVPV